MARYFEQKIVRKILTDAIEAGYQLVVDDGEEEFKPTTNIEKAFENLFAVDEARLYLMQDGKHIGWIFFVYGNSGWDVINDYTTNLEEFLKGANKLADEFEEGKVSEDKNVFPERQYNYNEISAIAEKEGLEITDCDKDDWPHITLAEPDGAPLYQFNYLEQNVDAESRLVLTWTDWD